MEQASCLRVSARGPPRWGALASQRLACAFRLAGARRPCDLDPTIPSYLGAAGSDSSARERTAAGARQARSLAADHRPARAAETPDKRGKPGPPDVFVGAAPPGAAGLAKAWKFL